MHCVGGKLYISSSKFCHANLHMQHCWTHRHSTGQFKITKRLRAQTQMRMHARTHRCANRQPSVSLPVSVSVCSSHACMHVRPRTKTRTRMHAHAMTHSYLRSTRVLLKLDFRRSWLQLVIVISLWDELHMIRSVAQRHATFWSQSAPF